MAQWLRQLRLAIPVPSGPATTSGDWDVALHLFRSNVRGLENARLRAYLGGARGRYSYSTPEQYISIALPVVGSDLCF